MLSVRAYIYYPSDLKQTSDIMSQMQATGFVQ